ncbi:HAD superfamily phosphatase (TIGR01668 family) [Bacillus mesophilus]|uniref:YqeG family HAD IIIA-type phosphatase n=1 Tax=Bacillus mesophilus TaxID=1808955 RepID=A0A6M0Q5Q4_9BACI|nr:YqeG family HAD IIIA-type phosphatase [Bacillus mesophilus]MBM7660757.1 HAD superfamily phosphatase (TIGR01668 family) [Bacillus mesophilus]NEY71696.1 YqeG family HAD IIIA-type phosphatase [Bacillus mesophilus]
MLGKFLPNEHVKSIFDIKAEALKERGIKGIITDLDNTLVEWDRPTATPELKEWFKSLLDSDITVTIVSNNNKERVEAFSAPIDVPFIFNARKPMTIAFKKALRSMNLKAEEVVVVGDQLLTDILGGNRIGLHTILVVPVAQTDGFVTRFNRKIERSILKKLKKKGMIHWED